MRSSLRILALPATALALASAAHSDPYRYAGAEINLGNQSFGPTHYADGDNEYNVTPSGGASSAFDYQGSFGGFDHQASPMVFTAHSSSAAELNRLHSSVQATLANSIYEGSSPYYNDDGSVNPDNIPDELEAESDSRFTDTLQYGGVAGSGYTARYLIHVDGTFTGHIDHSSDGYGDGASAFVAIGLPTIGIQTFQFFQTTPDALGHVDTTFATGDFAVDGSFAQDIELQLTSKFGIETGDFSDGSTLSGSGDFSSTGYISRVILYHNGVPVSNFTVTSTSGAVYPVPEPAAWATLGLGAVGVLRRRARK